MKRRRFLFGVSVGSIASFLASHISFGAKLKSPSPFNNGKDKQVCVLARRVFKVGELSKIEIEAPIEFVEKIEKMAVKRDDGETQFFRPQFLKSFKKDSTKITFEYTFPREDSYIIYLIQKGKKEKGKPKHPREFQRVYALDEDLYTLNPYKGDTHMHSRFSDGRDLVEYMVIQCLNLGFDFQAISDHKRYIGSQTARKIFEPLPISISCINAEECHQNPAPHIHSLGAKSGLTEYINENREAYDKRVSEILTELHKDLTKQEALSVARAEAEFELIRQLGGLAGLNHPYWRMGEMSLHLTKRVVDVLCARHKFDFLELVNCCADDSTDLALEKHSEMRENGYTAPIMGVSDAHKLESLGYGYTLAFAKSNKWEDIRDSIMTRTNVVIESFDKELPRIFGRIRYIQYAYFLYQYFFPLHDKICASEAELLKAYIKNKTPENKAKLAQKSEEVKQLYKEFFGRS